MTCRFNALVSILALVSMGATAQIVIGQTSGFSGPVASGVKENTEGAKLWFDQINRRGGINGQKIQLVSLDDQFQPQLAALNAKRLIVEHKALVLFLNRGTAHSEAIRPLLDEHKIALVAPSTGAMSLHSPVHPWIFNVRSSYQREAEKAVTLLASMGITRIALLHVDDGAGFDAASGAAKGFASTNLKPVLVQKFDRTKPDFAPIVESVVKADAQAVLFFGSAAAVSSGTKALRAAGSRAQVVTGSNNASEGFIRQMGEHARGTIVTQVFPSERALSIPIVRQAHDLALAKGQSGVTPAMLEGFAAAKVLVEAITRAGPSPTRQKLREALDGMSRVDIGGLEVTYSPDNHSGLGYADLAIIGYNGKYMR